MSDFIITKATIKLKDNKKMIEATKKYYDNNNLDSWLNVLKAECRRYKLENNIIE